MAEENDKKEEEKFELDSAGQALAYISLDQARVLAMEHARDNTGFYGRRYRRRELAWEVVSQESIGEYSDCPIPAKDIGSPPLPPRCSSASWQRSALLNPFVVSLWNHRSRTLRHAQGERRTLAVISRTRT